MRQLRYKLSNQLRHFREMHKFRAAIKKSECCVRELRSANFSDITQIDTIPASSIGKQITALILEIERLGRMLREFVQRVFIVQFATLGLASCAVLHQNFDKIRKKIEVVARVQAER